MTWDGRACRLGDACPCPHTSCRDGWRDDERHTDKAFRCRRCWEAWRLRVGVASPVRAGTPERLDLRDDETARLWLARAVSSG